MKSDADRPNAPTLVTPTALERVTARPGVGVLAGKVRRLRAQHGWTFQQLSERCGIAVSTLSKIETGQLSPTYEKIAALAEGLQVEVGDLFTPAEAVSGRRGVTRQGEGVLHASPQYDYEMLCADLSGKQFVPIRARVKAHSMAEFGPLLTHAGEEFVYVLAGELRIHSEFYEPLSLGPGDSCYFDSRMGHALLAGGDEDADILWISSKHALERQDDAPVAVPDAGTVRPRKLRD